ncbi:protein of unknown function (plasmid) [Streptantibioticus cattleyicolor NRRL 8057 = DSM 46488]|nr:protein of unknown function [Streptantibioticus cattleyicolor NRRL 8057 = DSM 46488]
MPGRGAQPRLCTGQRARPGRGRCDRDAFPAQRQPQPPPLPARQRPACAEAAGRGRGRVRIGVRGTGPEHLSRSRMPTTGLAITQPLARSPARPLARLALRGPGSRPDVSANDVSLCRRRPEQGPGRYFSRGAIRALGLRCPPPAETQAATARNLAKVGPCPS